MQLARLRGSVTPGPRGALAPLAGLTPYSTAARGCLVGTAEKANSQHSGNPKSRLFCHKRPNDLQNVTSILSSNKINGDIVEKWALASHGLRMTYRLHQVPSVVSNLHIRSDTMWSMLSIVPGG